MIMWVNGIIQISRIMNGMEWKIFISVDSVWYSLVLVMICFGWVMYSSMFIGRLRIKLKKLEIKVIVSVFYMLCNSSYIIVLDII